MAQHLLPGSCWSSETELTMTMYVQLLLGSRQAECRKIDWMQNASLTSPKHPQNFPYTYTSTWLHVCIHTLAHVHISMPTPYTYASTHVCTHTRVHTQIHTHTYTLRRRRSRTRTPSDDHNYITWWLQRWTHITQGSLPTFWLVEEQLATM